MKKVLDDKYIISMKANEFYKIVKEKDDCLVVIKRAVPELKFALEYLIPNSPPYNHLKETIDLANKKINPILVGG